MILKTDEVGREIGMESSVSQSAPALHGADTEAEPAAVLSLQDRSVAEGHCRTLWGERQDDCAKYGADISMPTVEVRVDELAHLLRGSAEAVKTIEGLGRLGELGTAFVDPSGVLNVAGLKDRIVELERASGDGPPRPFCMLGADTEALRGKLINALYVEVIHQQPEAVFRGQYGVLEIGEVKINCCALAHEALRAFKEAAGRAS